MCTHKREVLVDHGFYDLDGEWVEDERWEEQNTTEDVDTHHYRCTQCGQLFTYHGPLFTPA